MQAWVGGGGKRGNEVQLLCPESGWEVAAATSALKGMVCTRDFNC